MKPLLCHLRIHRVAYDVDEYDPYYVIKKRCTRCDYEEMIPIHK